MPGTRFRIPIAGGHTAPNFPIDLVAKDLGYAEAMVSVADVDPTVVPAVARLFRSAADRGLSALDIVGIARLHSPNRARWS